MSKIYIGHHKTWNINVLGKTPKECADSIGCEIADLKLEEMEKTDYLLLQVPEEFRSLLDSMAYERVEAILTDLIHDLAPMIQAFEKRIRSEVRP